MLLSKNSGFTVPPKTVVATRRSQAAQPVDASGIHVATQDMVEPLLELCQRAFGDALERLSPIDPAAVAADVRQMVTHPDRRVIVAVDDGKLIGVHVLGMHRAAYSAAALCALSTGLWVAPEFRTLGIEAKLLAAGEAWARSRGANHMTAVVFVPEEPKRGRRKAVAELKRTVETHAAAGFGLVEMRVAKRLK